MADDFKELIKRNILDQTGFCRAVFKGQRKGVRLAWQKVVIRPVLVKGTPHVQFSYFETQKNITKNYQGDDVIAALDELLMAPFKNYAVEASDGILHVQITKKGRAIVHHSQSPGPKQAPDLSHDRSKQRLLPSDEAAAPFLQAIGIMAQNGQIKSHMQKKYRQINEFLKLIDTTIQAAPIEKSPLHVVDCGCGNAALTFATYYYLNQILGNRTDLTGIDIKADLMEKHRKTGIELGWSGLTFQPVPIVEFKPDAEVDMILALHACDTATDEALAQGVVWNSSYIFSVPCCQHHLQQQLNRRSWPPEFGLVARHGILKEQLGDILTDTLRAAILRILGYKTDIVEFIASDHTPKNLMIRAIKSVHPGHPDYIQEYQRLKEYWGVTPYLEQLLGPQLGQFLS